MHVGTSVQHAERPDPIHKLAKSNLSIICRFLKHMSKALAATHCNSLLSVILCSAGDALEMLERCIQHTPSLLELYTVQCRILKHAGDPEGAAAAADKARSMDLADRYAQHWWAVL